MTVVREFLEVDSRDEGSASCVVCGHEIQAGQGLTVRHGERTLRFKCPGCLGRFEADPERYLAGQTSDCRDGPHAHSPASERADR